MKLASVLMAGAMAVGVGLTFAPTQASAGVCPTTIHTGNDATYGGCNLVIQFNANGSVATFKPAGATSNYDGSDDALIGVLNNTSHAITNFAINGNGNNIFGFDGDGIDTFPGGGAPVAGNPDKSGYGGNDGFFTGISGQTGTVNFANAGIAPGATDYFSLEAPINLAAPPIIGTPEPASMAVLGVGLAALGVAVRRRRRA